MIINIIIILIIICILYIEVKSYYLKLEHEQILLDKDSISELEYKLNTLNEKDKLLLKHFFEQHIKQPDVIKHKKKIYNKIKESIVTLTLLYILHNYSEKDHIITPITAIMTYLLTTIVSS